MSGMKAHMVSRGIGNLIHECNYSEQSHVAFISLSRYVTSN